MIMDYIAGKKYIVMEIDVVLLTFWDEHPSLGNIYEYEQKYFRLRDDCIEFLDNLTKYFNVGIWSSIEQIQLESILDLIQKNAK